MTSLRIAVAPHPLLEVGAFVQRFARPLGELATPADVLALAAPGAAAPFAVTDEVRAKVRALLRHGGFKPAGRNKPAAEYLEAARAEGRFPQINAAVDACNVVSLCSGLPISLVDVDRVVGPLAIRVLPPDTRYAFNPSGQVIDGSGLVALCDGEGPCGTPVKDAQRTKTHDATCVALAIVWGTRELPDLAAAVTAWYRRLAGELGATCEDVTLEAGPAPSAPPPPSLAPPLPPADPARYVAWMAARGQPLADVAAEAVALRIGSWGFFAHGAGPGQSLDRAALDREGHAVQRGTGAWHALLRTPGLDAAGALERVAWLYSAIAVPAGAGGEPPTLAASGEVVTWRGCLAFPPETGRVLCMTIAAGPDGATFTTAPRP